MIQLIECVPNFSEGRNLAIIKQITDVIESVEGIKLLDVDPGAATNRTVVTFVGQPQPVMEAAFRAMQKAKELIDMSKHKGEHPRFGATDVCPFVPVSNITLEETAAYARQLAERVGRELEYPVYLYESAASRPERKNLATVRAGEYEGLAKKLEDPNWMPDFGGNTFRPTVGATAIGARDFLIAVNFNLNTTSTRRANSVAFDVREAGRLVKQTNPATGQTEEVRVAGSLKACKAIGWYIAEYGVAQVSMNLTDIGITPIHVAFDEVNKSATARGLRVTGTEIVGLLPLKALTEAGKYFLRKQERSVGVSEKELIKIAVKSMGLDELRPFEPEKKIIEYILKDANSSPLINMNLEAFADETASESPAPGGGSIAAYCGALGVSLGTMVANLSSHKRGWDERWEEFSDWAEKGEKLKKQLLYCVDEDTRAFNRIMDAFGLPKSSDAEKQARKAAIQAATRNAIEVPFKVMELSFESMEMLKAMAETGNPNSVSDAGVGALCARTAVWGAWLNVKINAASYDDEVFKSDILAKAKMLAEAAAAAETAILAIVESKL
ncbi:glutamate formiminotransferase / formiminotetrahydrofolate cyclodeaminase [Flexibacter flexilis DSM 6793]|uniref:Formimidoyltransferase-cyclodeaminase n=1 Tax=Flexibacter flexilis DSM 6793 TaxID=927664 RepID=A0A1I1M3F0_9BACT|nr:glutamate formimidoyltransferase [Flexibacter flexilis]SFC76170.1 glutamate formiminotransferase / formiminotetrahydrofolate cyclodeaminase [Flexibacter flexilis DSM 6793]